MAKKIIRVGVDLDEVLVRLVIPLTNYYNKKYNTNILMTDYDGRTWDKIWGITGEQVNKVICEFSDTDEFSDLEPVPGVKESLLKLKKTKMFEFYIVTARSHRLYEKTYHWINKHFKKDTFSGFEFGNSHGQDTSYGKREKYEICKELNCSLLIDDDINHLIKCAKVDVTGLLFNFQGEYSWCNINIFIDDKIKHVTSWGEIETHLLDYYAK
jgi:uncharacterized HAD superfamily protein